MKLILTSLLLMSSAWSANAAPVDTFYENSSGTPLLSLVQNAKTSIDIEIYEMDDTAFLGAIKDAVDRGVRVRVVKEDKPVGAVCRVFAAASAADNASCKTQKDLVKYVQNGGGRYVAFDHAQLCGIKGSSCFEHGKIVISDGAQALISTGNFNGSNLCDKADHPAACNRDYSVVSKDLNVVGTLTQLFEDDLKAAAYDVSGVLSNAPTQKLTVSPLSLKPLIAFIHSAKTKIQIQNQYLKDPDLNDAIVAAAQSGVQVEVMVASTCSFGKPSASENRKWTATFTDFDTASVKSRIFTREIKINGVGGYLHAKAIVVDGTRAWVGSVNGSTTSLDDNREYGIFLDDATEVKKLQKVIDQDFANPAAESWQDSLLCKNDPKASGGDGDKPPTR